MRACALILALLGCSAVAVAQLSPEEATQRLRERQRQRQAEQQAAASQPSSPQPSAAQSAAPTSRPSGVQIGRLLHQAWDHLMARRYGQAVALFDKALAGDPRDAVALEGRGICKYELKQYKPAERDLEEAWKLAGKAPSARASRQLSIAVAAANTMNDNPMRAARVLRGLMEPLETDNKLDEELQNDLGIALAHANAQGRKQQYFRESLKYYMEYDKKLNQQKNDGTARWGTQWIAQSAADQNWSKYETASTDAERAAANYDHAVLAEEHAKDHYIELHGLRLHSTEEIKTYTAEYKQAILTTGAARTQMNKANDRLSKVEKPPFPDRIEHDWREPR